jgi:hypothetical protein
MYLSKADWKDLELLDISLNALRTGKAFRALAKASWHNVLSLNMSNILSI